MDEKALARFLAKVEKQRAELQRLAARARVSATEYVASTVLGENSLRARVKSAAADLTLLAATLDDGPGAMPAAALAILRRIESRLPE